MGGNMSVNLANLYIKYVLEEAMYKTGITPKIKMKYIDNILVILNNLKVEVFMKFLNNIHKKLDSLVNGKSENKINFPDLTITKEGGSLVTKWFRKPRSASKMIHFKSIHPWRYKTNAIINLFTNAVRNTDEKFINEIKENVFRLAIDNWDPIKIVNKVWKFFIKKIKGNANIKVDRIEIKKREVNSGELDKYIEGKSKEEIENKCKEEMIERERLNN